MRQHNKTYRRILLKQYKNTNMKNTFLLSLVIITLFAGSVAAQDSTRSKTWFSNTKNSKRLHYIGAYVSPEVQYGSLAGSFTPISGMSAMLVFNKKWALGLAAYGTATEFTPSSINTNKALSYEANYGGLKLEYTPKPNDVLHVSFPILIGAGMANIDSVSTKTNYSFNKRGDKGRGGDFGREDRNRNENEDAFFIFQPGIKLETNVLRIAKLFIGANYRIAAGKSSLTSSNTALIPTSAQLSGVSFSFGAKIGVFDFDVQKKRHFPRFGFGRRGNQKYTKD